MTHRNLVQVEVTSENIEYNGYFQIFLTDDETKELNDVISRLEDEAKIREYKILEGG